MLDHVLIFEGKLEKVNFGIVEYNLYRMAHNGSGFDSYVVINNLPQWRSIVNLIKIEAGIVSQKNLKDMLMKTKDYLNVFISDVGEFILIV